MVNDYIEIKENAELGRFATITADISAGEILFEEYPFVVGPKPNTPVICLACCCPVDGTANGSRCPKCKWPLCENCYEAEVHLTNECKVFVENKVVFHNMPDDSTEETVCLQLECITPLRFLLEKEKNQERWDREIAPMEYHEVARRDSEMWKADEVNIVGYLHGPCKLKNRFSKELIQQVCGILEINSFEGRTVHGYNIQCVYPKTAILAHSCVPNTTHTILPSKNFRINVRATVDIAKDELLCTTYTYTLSGTMARQEHLKYGKFFTCRCKRCLDPTELNTNFSSFKCSKCDPGFLLSTDTLDMNAQWKCTNCDFTTSGANIQKALDVIQAEVDGVANLELGAERLEKYEKLFRRYRSVLHPLHFIQTGIRKNLIEMYGRVDGYEMQDLPDVMLEHKIDLCRDFLRVLDVLHPGKIRTRALLLYELHAPIVLKAKSEYAAGTLDGEPLKKQLQEAIDMLDECATILEWEDVVSAERMIAKIARQALEQLTASIVNIDA